MAWLKGERMDGVVQIEDPVSFNNGVTGAGGIVQGKVYYVDNSNVNANDRNTGLSKESPKLTIQSAIDEADANSGSVVYVMGSGLTYEYNASNVINLSGSDLYGVYRENVHLDNEDHGLQLIGVNRPFITGNDGTSENEYGHTPTIQIGTVGVSGKGPKYCRISGFLIGGWGDDDDDAADANAYGVGIAIGEYHDASYNDDCYSHLIDNCTFRATNCEAGGNYVNTEDVHSWIKGFGNEKITVRNCSFFQGQYAIAMMSNQNNKAMQWDIDNCLFWYTTTACVYSNQQVYWSVIRNSLFHPATAEQELDSTALLGSTIVDCVFPQCDETVTTSTNANSIVVTPALGVFTGWNVINGKGQKGMIYTVGS